MAEKKLFKTPQVLGRIISSKKFYLFVLVAFLLQGLFFAGIITSGETSKDGTTVLDYGVAPDEVRHFGNVMYFAERPLQDGPFVSHIEPKDLVLGDVQTFPSYLFYYILSFPARIMIEFGVPDSGILFMLRVIVLITGLVGLIVLRKLIAELTSSRLIQNMGVFALANTGAYLWFSAALSYDPPSLMLMFAIMLFCVRALKNMSAFENFTYAILLAFLIPLIKYTYLPFAFLFVGAAIAVYVHRVGYPQVIVVLRKKIYRPVKSLKLFAVLIGLVLTIGLFSEKIVGNLVQYRTVNPVCVHETKDCMRFEIFKRNYEVKQAYDKAVQNGTVKPYHYSFFGHFGMWLDSYFISTFTYRAHVKDMKPVSYILVSIVMAFLVLFALILVRLRKLRIKLEVWHWFALLSAGTYALATYIFNVKTLFDFGQVLAYQGRYLLFSLAILFVVISVVMARYIKSETGIWRKVMIPATLVVFLLWAFFYNPVVSFFMHVDNLAWYSEPTKQLLPDRILDGIRTP